MAFVCEWKNSKFNNNIICAFYYLIRLRKKVFNDIFICAAMCGYASSVWLYQPSPLMASRWQWHRCLSLDTICFMPSGYILFHAIRIQSVSCHPDTICFMPSGYKGNNLLLVVSGHWDWIWIVSEAPYIPYTVYSNKKLTFTLVADPWKNR